MSNSKPIQIKSSNEVLEIGASVLVRLPEPDQAIIRRQLTLIQDQIKPMGPVGALEIVTALGIYLAKKYPQQGPSAAGRRA